jgi:TorA maturation chaperone TorD
LGPGELPPKELSLPRLFEALDEEWETLEDAYRHLFGMTAISASCPPCEVEYEPNEDINYRSQRLADIAGFYRAFGLDISNRAGERLDHIATQAEFLYVLLAKEAVLVQEGNQTGAEICRNARRTFFEEHVGWWLPVFSTLLSRAAPNNFYRELASFMASLSAAERICLGLSPFRVRCAPKPVAVEATSGCGDCPGN